jgi:hypothetical protein
MRTLRKGHSMQLSPNYFTTISFSLGARAEGINTYATHVREEMALMETEIHM